MLDLRRNAKIEAFADFQRDLDALLEFSDFIEIRGFCSTWKCGRIETDGVLLKVHRSEKIFRRRATEPKNVNPAARFASFESFLTETRSIDEKEKNC